MKAKRYDYIIIGAGAAGIHLALAMLEVPFFAGKQILMLDKDDKSTNDKTYSYWEKGNGPWDALTYQSWSKGVFIDEQGVKELELNGYQYKSIRAIDFYNFGRERIESSENINWIKENVIEVHEGTTPMVKTKRGNFQAKHIFDSRIPSEFFEKASNFLNVKQHFKGWVIETKEAVFDPNTFTMMDYRVTFEDQTFFIYVLPTSATTALVEATFFTAQLVAEEVYDRLLKTYIEDTLQVEAYHILDQEKGYIPMTNFPFHKYNKSNITLIGTAGGWVRASSGYAFRNIALNAQKIVSNLMQGNAPSKGIGSGKFRAYDTLFLEILQNKNHLGGDLFKQMYRKIPADLLFKFLDQESSVWEDLMIISRLSPGPFLRALMKQI